MCASCSVNGAQNHCPTCRDLSPTGFPGDANSDLGTLWNHAFSSFQREAAMVIVAGLIFFAFALGGGLVANVINKIIGTILGLKIEPTNPFSNLRGLGLTFLISQVVAAIVNLAVQGIALVGLYRVLMDTLMGKKADLARMFSQLHVLPNYIVMHLIMFFLITLPTLTYFGVVAFVGGRLIGVDWSHPSDFHLDRLSSGAALGTLLGLTFLSVIVFLLAEIVLLPVMLFATPELMVGQCGPVEALKRAWDLGNGQRLRCFGYSFIAGLVMIAGVFACLVGVIAALPLAYMLILALFLALRKSSSLPPAIHT